MHSGGIFVKTLTLILTLSVLLAACSNTSQAPLAAAPDNTQAIETLPVMPEVQVSPDNVANQAVEPYNISLQFIAGTPQSVQDALNTAARRWEGVIRQGLPSVSGSIRANACGGNAVFSGTIDDILVFTGTKAIDGAGKTLAQSGPCFIRSSGGLTYASVLIFDSADVNQFGSQLAAIATHELGHSLGLGTLWKYKGVLRGAGTTDPRFTGLNAVREWNALGGTGQVPVENTGGAGTRDGHWRESILKNELMTGFLNGGNNPMSRISIASFADLGYQVDLNAANPYSLSALSSSTLDQLEVGEELITPFGRAE
jgi:hypothetical protein